MPKILTKNESFERMSRGEFGNTLTNWQCLSEFYDAIRDGVWPTTKPVALRLSTRPGRTPPFYCTPVSPSAVNSLALKWVRYGYDSNQIRISEVAPDEFITLQGEIFRNETGYSLRYSTAKTIMRHAFKEHEANCDGLKALDLVRRNMDAESFLQMQELFDEYPTAIIEFSCYSVGLCKKLLNTLFWEVRDY